MIVNNQNIEFGYELISALPYAYWLYKNNQLEKTISGIDTKCLYYFSKNHEEINKKRSWYNTSKAKNIPNIDIHKPYLLKDKFTPPPLKDFYKNDRFKFKKDTVIICNRVNKEWGQKPLNYFSLEALKEIFDLLKDKYQIIYINISGKKEYYDNENPIEINDYDFIKENYPGVINIHNLHTNNSDLTFNELQLMLFANCSKFITMNGGYAILASYFGGENIIMSKYGNPQAQELDPSKNDFYRYYGEFGNSRIIYVENENKLIKKITSLWVKKEPIINILIRTTNRPNYFKKCIESIEKQDYENINILVSYETIEDLKYIIPYKCFAYKVIKKVIPELINKTNDYGIKFHSNLYLNDLAAKVKSGFIMYLDDDDILTEHNTINLIASKAKKSDLVFWKVNVCGQIMPSDKNFTKDPVLFDTSGLSFAFNVKYKEFAIWEGYKRGDFRVAKNLYINIKNKSFIDKVLTRTQNNKAGNGLKIDIKEGRNINIKLPKNRQIFNYTCKEDILLDNIKKNLIFGQTYKFKCMPSGNTGFYKYNGIVEKMIKNKQLIQVK